MKIRVAQAAGIAVLLVAAGCATSSPSPSATADAPPAVAPPDTVAPAPPPQPEPAPTLDPAAPAPPPVEGDAPRDALIGLLAELRTVPESSAAYDRDDYEHDRAHLCDASGVDPYTGLAFDASSCDVDHIVAAKEAHESGGHTWDVVTREQFGNDALNLVASRDCVNRSKGSSDSAEWSGVQSGTCQGAQLTAAGRCFWAARTVAVKYRYHLAVDARELAELESGLNQCPLDINAEAPAQAPLTTMPTTQVSPPPPPIAETTAAGSDCHPAYEPCLPNLPGDALNCGDLTASQRPVRVKQADVDPYALDRDGDGEGCTG